MSVFLGNFKSKNYVGYAFDEAISDFEIVVAAYNYGDYCGGAYVLATKDGNLFEVEGSHCSCYGLEDQWKPTEVNAAYLKNRIDNGTFIGSYLDDATDTDAAIKAAITAYLENVQ